MSKMILISESPRFVFWCQDVWDRQDAAASGSCYCRNGFLRVRFHLDGWVARAFQEGDEDVFVNNFFFFVFKGS